MSLNFIQMVGIPGSGKSERAKLLARSYDAVLLSSDAIREEIAGDVLDQSKNEDVFKEMNRRTCDALSQGKSVVYDATNINWKRRRTLLEYLKAKYDIYAMAVVMATPIQMCIDRQQQRDRKVPKDVIWRMVKGFFMPHWCEGWDNIQLCYPDFEEYISSMQIDDHPVDKILASLYRDDIPRLHNKRSLLYDFDQKNPHYSLTLGEHMYKCYELMCCETHKNDVREAALLHDLGKFLTQSVENGVAHYYDHQNVSAYLSMFSRDASDEHVISRAAYIQWHMAPYSWKEEKTHEKYKRLFGETFYNNLMLLYACDMQAH